MTSEEVALIVRQQIAGQWTRRTSHGFDLRECILPHPTSETFTVRTAEAATERTLWIVLEEDPRGRSGYVVVYDEDLNVFGLAVRDAAGKSIHIGDYGDFWATLDAM